MTIPNTGRRTVRPTHPGEMLREKRSVIPEMALPLARLFSNAPEFWLNAQRAIDLWDAARAIDLQVKRIKLPKVA